MPSRTVDNSIYDRLGERWYRADDDPIALLRAESRFRNPWIIEHLRAAGARDVLDVGCGGGFLANPLSAAGFRVTGLDQSAEALGVAARYDRSDAVRYVVGDGYRLPFDDGSFDAVAAMDFLEHVEEPGRVIAEAARVLRPGGQFFFYTFNRNPLSHLIVIKGVEWRVRNTPPDLHVIDLFITPAEMRAHLADAGLVADPLRGVRPRVFTRAFGWLLLTGKVRDDFAFTFTSGLALSYMGRAIKPGDR